MNTDIEAGCVVVQREILVKQVNRRTFLTFKGTIQPYAESRFDSESDEMEIIRVQLSKSQERYAGFVKICKELLEREQAWTDRIRQRIREARERKTRLNYWLESLVDLQMKREKVILKEVGHESNGRISPLKLLCNKSVRLYLFCQARGTLILLV